MLKTQILSYTNINTDLLYISHRTTVTLSQTIHSIEKFKRFFLILIFYP